MDNLSRNSRFDYLATSRDHAFGFYVLGTGNRMVAPESRYQVYEKDAPYQWEKGRVLPIYGMVYLTQGQGKYRSRECDEQKVRAGDLLLLFPGVWHNYFPLTKTGWTEYWVLFNGAQPQYLADQGVLSPSAPIMHPGLDDELHQLFIQMLKCAQDRPPGYNYLLAGMTFQILAKALSLVQGFENSQRKMEPAIQKAKIYLEDHWDRIVDMTALARSLHVTYRHFRGQFKASTGISPHQYHLHVKINKAKELLEEQRLEIKEIAALLGFNDPYYFSRLFKKKTGLAPSELR
jgi:AraC-like DNA-binding protein